MMLILKSEEDYNNIPKATEDKLYEYLQFATANVPFYSKLRDELHESFNIKSFFKFPLTYDYDLINDPISFLGKKNSVVQLSSSGGTYGKRKIVFRTNDDIKRSIETTVKMFRCGGLNSNDKIAILQPFDLWNIGHLALRAFQKIGALSCPFGLSADNGTILNMLKDMRCNILYSTPSKALSLAKISEEKGINSQFSIDKVFCAGEPILDIHRETISKIWGADTYGIYGSEETDGIGAECRYHNGYHILNDFLILEVLDPESLMPANTNIGVLAITQLEYDGTVLIRYLLNDIVEITNGGCSCDCQVPKIRILGRRKQTLHLFDGRKVSLSSIEDALKEVFPKMPIYQLIIEHHKDHDVIMLNIKSIKDAEKAEKVKTSIIDCSQDLKEGFGKEEIKIKVQMDESISFISTSRGKAPKIIEKRKEQEMIK